MLLGPPGSGKGTLAKQLEGVLRLDHLSTGDIFREQIRQRTALGKAVSRYVTKGLLVPDALVVQVMTSQLSAKRLRQGFVLDGFPRTKGQAQGLERFLTRQRRPLTAAIHLACPASVLVTRLSGRRVCSACGAIYHVRRIPPKRRGICDACGGALKTRQDDQVATIRKRLAIHHAQEAPLLAYYRRRDALYVLSGYGSSDQTFRRAVRLMEDRRWITHEPPTSPSARRADGR